MPFLPPPDLDPSQALGPSSPHRHFVKDLGRSCTKIYKNLLACGANQLLSNGEIVHFLPPPELERSQALGPSWPRRHFVKDLGRSCTKMEWAPSRRVDAASKGQLGN